MRYKSGHSRSELSIGLVDEVISGDHYLRILDAFIDSVVSQSEASYSLKGRSWEGQKPYGARTMLKLYLYGYLNRVNSSRRLAAECRRNIEVIWLLGGLQPDFKTIADYRKDHGESIRSLRDQFQVFLHQHGYIQGKSVSIDGMKVKANTHRDTLSVEKISKRLGKLGKQLDQYLDELALSDAQEAKLENLTALSARERLALERIAQLEAEISELEKKKR